VGGTLLLLLWGAAGRAQDPGAQGRAQGPGAGAPVPGQLGQLGEDGLARPPGEAALATRGLPGADVDAIARIHELNQRQLEHARLGEERAASARTRALGRRMLETHHQIEQQLALFLRENGMTVSELPGRIATAGVDGRDQLHTIAADRFDREFAQVMARDGDDLLSVMRASREATTNADLRKLLRGLETALARHVRSAQALEERTR
jgi:predicted outer membrane protein